MKAFLAPHTLGAIGAWLAKPRLADGGIFALTLLPAGALWATFDGRVVSCEPVALKPMRFAVSIAVYLFTVSWMLGYVDPERLSAPVIQDTITGLLAGAGLELACIVFQAARGRRSHFNLAAPTDAIISSVMMITSVLFVGMLFPLAWEIARYPRACDAPLMSYGIVGGLVATSMLSALTGAGMEHAASTAFCDVRRPSICGIAIRGGRRRVAHFLGVHAMQAFPLMASAALTLRDSTSAAVVLTAAASCYAAITIYLGLAPLSERPSLTNC